MQSTSVVVQGLGVHVLRAGEGESPVLLLHGGGLDSASLSWRLTIGPLAAAGHRVFAPDWPGYGTSDKPDRVYSVEFYVDILHELLGALGLERAHLAGISLGGAVALGLALSHPEQVERLVLVDSYGLGDTLPYGALGYLLVHMPWLNDLTWKLLARSRSMVRKSLEQFVARSEVITDDMVDEMYAAIQQPGVAAAWRSFQRHETQWLRLRTDYTPRLAEVRAPTLIVHGAGDALVPLAWAERAQRLIPDARLSVLPGAKHWPPREQPEAFNRLLIEFLS